MSINEIKQALAGERVVALSPEDAGAAATDWLRRPNLFPGRALTAPTLEHWQRWQAGRVTERGQAFTPGVVEGFEVSHVLEPVDANNVQHTRVLIEPGQGLTVTGETIAVPRRVEFLLSELPVVAPQGWFVAQTPDDEEPGPIDVPPAEQDDDSVLPAGALQARMIGGRLADVIGTAGTRMSGFGVLVLQPVTVDVSNFDPNDPCDRCACREDDNVAALEDWRIADGVRVLWYPWPEEWRALPFTPTRARNEIAHTIFEAEALLPHGESLPWEKYGVPIAIARISEPLRIEFVDRGAVVRQGGRAREARLQLFNGTTAALAANSRLPALWQARIEQFAEQVTSMGEPTPAPQALADPFLHLPPCGLLPKIALNLETFQTDFFPPLFTLDATPVPLEQLDLAIREAAPMASLDVGVPERVRVLVPVTQASWEPRLLHHENIDSEFDLTLKRFLLDRARALGGRQGLRSKRALLAHAVDGALHEVIPFDKDDLAIEPETLTPWGPPPSDGGHRSALMPGIHQHFFELAPTFAIGKNDMLYAWIFLDPENPPRTVMLQWNVKGSWEHRAFLGEDLIPWGTAGSPGRYHVSDDLPTAGAWVKIEVSAEKVGIADTEVNGMAFTLFDGRAAYGQTGATDQKKLTRKWFSNFIPLGASAQGNESWDLLTHNDLWAPFENDNGVVPSLPEPLISGAAGNIPDPTEPTGSPTARLPLPTSGLNVLYPRASGWRGHQMIFLDFSGGFRVANGPLLAKDGSDTLSVWVYSDELTPPRSLWFELYLTPSNEQFPSGKTVIGSWFFGEDRRTELNKVGLHFEADDSSFKRAGALPQSGVWVELNLPLPDLSKIATENVRLSLIKHAAFDGTIAFSDLVVRRGTAPDVPEVAWPVSIKDGQPQPEVAPLRNSKPELQTGPDVLTPTQSARIGTVRVYTELMRDPSIRKLSGHEQSQVLLRGVEGFADYLRTRIDRADDITDFGFAHMQVDMHRVRQLTLSTSDISRLAISPALAAIAKSDSAFTVQSQIKDYLTTVKAAAAAHPPITFSVSAALAGAGTSAIAASVAPSAAASAAPSAAQSMSFGLLKTQTTVQNIQFKAAAGLIKAPAAPLNIVFATPVVGLSEIRTTAIAERLRNPPSTEARDYALANRQRTVRSMLELLKALRAEDSSEIPALFVDFEVIGLAGDPFLVAANVTPPRRKLIDFVNDVTLIEKLITPPAPPGAIDEATLFTQTVALSDNTIAMLRAFEGRIALYRTALSRCESALADLLSSVAAVDGRLTQFADVLAEARHDVGVARALIAEEQARIDDVNARRRKILEEEVKFLAYVRPRETSNVTAAPRRVIDPALAEAPVPACLRDHHDVPDELEDMLRVVREAPAAWFVQVPKLLDRLDRPDILLRAMKSAQLRLPQMVARPLIAAPVAGKLGIAVTQVLARQNVHIVNRLQTLNRVNFDVLAAGTWQNLRAQAQEIVSLGDLIDGEHGKGAVARDAAAEFDRIAAVCSCLHAEFCGVSASIRLDWAELFSQFDEAPNLRNLGNLPRWAEIDSTDRRQMQAYVDFLFATLEARQAQGEPLINDVIRMCLLLASHAPVGRIIGGRLPRPITGVRPGIRIPLVALEPAKLRIGMQAILYQGNQVKARALVEDVGSGEVSARVLHTSAATVDLDLDVKVHFDHAGVVSAPAARIGGTFKL